MIVLCCLSLQDGVLLRGVTMNRFGIAYLWEFSFSVNRASFVDPFKGLLLIGVALVSLFHD